MEQITVLYHHKDDVIMKKYTTLIPHFEDEMMIKGEWYVVYGVQWCYPENDGELSHVDIDLRKLIEDA